MDPALPTPKDHAEAVAVFRAQIIGPALARSLSRGELAALLRELASKDYVPPGAKRRHRFGASTLERWYSAVCFVMRSGHRRCLVRLVLALAWAVAAVRIIWSLLAGQPVVARLLVLCEHRDEGDVRTGRPRRQSSTL
jgi:hypothetical protein